MTDQITKSAAGLCDESNKYPDRKHKLVKSNLSFNGICLSKDLPAYKDRHGGLAQFQDNNRERY